MAMMKIARARDLLAGASIKFEDGEQKTIKTVLFDRDRVIVTYGENETADFDQGDRVVIMTAE